MSTNEELVAAGLRILREPLSLFICHEIEKEYGDSWWTEGVVETLVYSKRPTVEDVLKFHQLPESGSVEECASHIDISVCLILLTKHWYRIFGPVLGKDHRGWAFELIGVRNQNKHLPGRDHASDYAWRALDTMYRLVESIDADAAAELQTRRSSVDLSAYGQGSAASASTSTPATAPNAVVTSTPPPSGLDSPITTATDLDEDLSALGLDFSGADLRKMDFAGSDLTGADFEGADLTGANLTGAKLIGANFKDATLADANLATADLTGSHFEGTALSAYFDKERTSFSKAQHHGADLSGATLDKATLNFAGCNLKSVNFGAVNLEGADFEGADLTGANLKGAKLVRVNLRNANIKDADTTDVQWT